MARIAGGFFMRIVMACVGLALAACAGTPRPASDPAASVEAFMWEYTKTWNRHDAAAIATDFYRMGPSVADQTASVQRQFDGLAAQGYDHSDIHAIKACMTGPDTAWAGMRFSRLKADGAPLPPTERASAYEVKKFADGWRITKLTGDDASRPLACPG
jgi:hypothetical protein